MSYSLSSASARHSRVSIPNRSASAENHRSREKKCPAHECAALKTFAIDAAKCKGCTACAKKCPAGAISGSLKNPHVIDPAKCVKCGACAATCRFGAVVVG